jgi:hypothetical protein
MVYANDVIRSLKDLPNHNGFKFIGVKKDGTCVDCHVERDSQTNTHFVAGGAGFDELQGWKYKPK